MDTKTLQEKVPTFYGWWDRRRKKRQNQLPKHLRPMSTWPIWIQCALNVGIMYALYSIMVDQDDYLTDAGPAMGMAVCLILLLFTIPTAIRLKRRYRDVPGERLAKINFWLMGVAFLLWPLTVALYL